MKKTDDISFPLPKEEFDDHIKKAKKLKSEKSPKKTGRWEEWEVAYIKSNWDHMTDLQIGEQLHREAKNVTVKRQSLKLIKNNASRPSGVDGITNDELNKRYKSDKKKAYEALSKEEKRKLFDNQFKNSQRYKELKEVLSESEIATYAEKWMDYISTWETVLTTEEDTLHLAILELIRAHRVLVRQKAAMDNPSPMNAVPIEMYEKSYKEIVENYNKMMQQLSGTRQQRLSVNREEKMTLVSVVQALQDNAIRKKAGDEEAMLGAASQMTASWLRQNNYLVDGE